MRKIIIPAVIIMATVSFQACSSSKEHETVNTNQAPVKVSISNPSGSGSNGFNASGQLESVNTTYLSTRLMGIITALNVKEGDQVKKGQVLATIQSQDIQAKQAQTQSMITEAEAHFNNAKKDLDRFTALYEKKSASAKELDNINLQYQAAKARLDAAKQMKNEVNAMIRYATITAPYDGIITRKNAEAGSMANPGMPILVIERTGNLLAHVAIPESNITALKTGKKATLTIKSTGKSIDGTISEINPSSQFTGGQYMVKITIPADQQKGLYSGMYVNAFIPTESKMETTNAVMVPKSSIIHRDQLTGIYTVGEGDVAILRWVRLGKERGDQVEVLSGLNSSESFILSSEGKLYNGAPIKN